MLTVTVGDIITQARKANGTLGDGIVIAAEEASDDLMALNMMLAEWSASGYGIFVDTEETFTLTANKYIYDWGSAATATNFVSPRPNDICDQTFLRIGEVDYKVGLIGQAEYDSISDKTITKAWPNKIFFEASYPLARVYLYPVPDQAYSIHITSSKVMDSLVNLVDTVVLPSQYAAALKWNLSMEIAPNYGVQVTPIIANRAKVSLNIVKALNANQKLEQVRVQVVDNKPDVYLKSIQDGS
jgi:hypothetical protein